MTNVVDLSKTAQAKGRMARTQTKAQRAEVEEPAKNGPVPSNLTVPISSIIEGDNPRQLTNDAADKELVASVKRHGILQPIRVRPVKGGKYEVIAGHRRFAAAQAAKVTAIPVFIATPTDDDAYVQSLVENLQRENLNPLDEAKAFVRLLAKGISQKDLGKIVNKSQPYISNAVGLLETTDKVQAGLASGKINVATAKAIKTLPEDQQDKIADEAAKGSMSVREVEQRAQDIRNRTAQIEREKKAREDRIAGINAALELALKDKTIKRGMTVALDVYDLPLEQVTVPKGLTVVRYDWQEHHYQRDGFSCKCKAVRMTTSGSGDNLSATVHAICVDPEHEKEYRKAQAAKQREAEKAARAKQKALEDELLPFLTSGPTSFSDEGLRLLAYSAFGRDREIGLALCKAADVKHPKIANYETLDGALVWEAITKVEATVLYDHFAQMIVNTFIPDVYRESKWALERGAPMREWLVDRLGLSKDLVWGGREDELFPKPAEPETLTVGEAASNLPDDDIAQAETGEDLGADAPADQPETPAEAVAS